MANRDGNDLIVGAPPAREGWSSRAGFVLASAGSAVGLGNIWKFPYITGMNGGGEFVLVYLVCIALIGMPVMIGEVMIGRAAQRSTVPAYEDLSGGRLIWSIVGWMGVLTGFILLSYYSVVAGWAVDYIKLAITGSFDGMDASQIAGTFGELYQDVPRNVGWHALFMLVTIGIVLAGVQKGIEIGARIMMPLLVSVMIGLVVYASTRSGFGDGATFIFKPDPSRPLTGAGALEALGHSFFTLSLGMGALITYGSYLGKKDDIFTASATITGIDTLVAMLACLIMFPLLFSAGMGPAAGPGLVFVSMPTAFAQMPGGYFLGILFFVLLFFAALTSSISLLEVVTATIIDKFGVPRRAATIGVGLAIFGFGIPSAYSEFRPFPSWLTDKNFFDAMDWAVSNAVLPLGGLAIAIFVGWVVPRSITEEQFNAARQWGWLYSGWRFLIRFMVPLAIIALFLHTTGLLRLLMDLLRLLGQFLGIG